jgi:hypothetical protein
MMMKEAVAARRGPDLKSMAIIVFRKGPKVLEKENLELIAK